MFKERLSFKKIIATLLGTALFIVFFMYCKLPSPIESTHFQIAYAISAFFGAVFGPFVSTMMVFLGHLTNDILIYDICWSWIIASTVTGFFSGLAYYQFDLAKGEMPNFKFYAYNIIGHGLAWLIIAPALDRIIYDEAWYIIFEECSLAFANNTLSSVILGGLFCVIYAKTRKHSFFDETEDELDK